MDYFMEVFSAFILGSVQVDISHLNLEMKSATLSYGRAVELRDQIQLMDVQLKIGDIVFYPRVHLAAYLDEVSGTEVCRQFGYGRGVLGAAAAMPSSQGFSFSANGRLEVSEMDSSRITSQVFCDKR